MISLQWHDAKERGRPTHPICDLFREGATSSERLPPRRSLYRGGFEGPETSGRVRSVPGVPLHGTKRPMTARFRTVALEDTALVSAISDPEQAQWASSGGQRGRADHSGEAHLEDRSVG